MGQLDTALIKAYGKLSANSERATMPSRASTLTASAPAAGSVKKLPDAALPAAPQVNSTAAPDGGQSTIHGAARVIPAPHVRFSPPTDESTKLAVPRIAAHTVDEVHPAAEKLMAPHAFRSTGTRTPIGHSAFNGNDGAETISVISKVCPKAAFQVEQFVKPAVCTALLGKLSVQFDQLAEQLIAGLRLRRNLLAIGGSSDQAGATTFLICTATKMAEQGLNVLMLDGDWSNPQLANQLGVKPELSWQDEVLSERSIGECWIESATDRLTLIQLSTPTRGLDDGLVEQLPRFLRDVGDVFDLVLIDIGQPVNGTVGNTWLGPPVDGLVLVENLKLIERKRSEQLRRTLDQSQLAWWGVAENFV